MFFNTPTLIGHRGLKAFAPENTLSSFEVAYQKGFKWVEFDVQLTSDYTPIILHDDTVDRTTNGFGKLNHLSWAELSNLDAGSWFSPAFQGARIPTFVELMSFLNHKQMAANIEIKSDTDWGALLIAKTIIPLLPDSFTPERLLFSSFQHDCIFWIRQYYPQLPAGFLMEKIDWSLVSKLTPEEHLTLHCDFQQNSLEDIQKMVLKGFCVLVYTVNDESIAKKLWDIGVKGIFTDALHP